MSKVSVVMPAYNAEQYICEAIESILNQTYKDFEFIIINDGSTDRTKEIIKSYNDPRIVYLENEKNSGIVVTLNKGLDFATGEYIARMDADDVASPKRFEKQVAYMGKNKGIGVLGTGIIIFGEGMAEKSYSFSSNARQAKADLFFNSSLAHPTVMIRRSVLTEYKLAYEEEYNGLEDFVLWWRIAQVAEVNSLKEPLLYYRKHISQITKTRSEEFYQKYNKFIKERLSIFSVDVKDYEYNLLVKYCNGGHDQFTKKEIVEYIKFLKKMLDDNKKNKYFSNKELRHTFELSVSYIIHNIPCKEGDRKKLHGYAFQKRVLTSVMMVKLIIHKVLRK